MAKYLLGTQSLFDLGLFNDGPVQKWFEAKAAQRGLFTDDVVISAFSAAVVQIHFQRNRPITPDEAKHGENLDTLIKRFGEADQIVGASPEVIAKWAELSALQLIYLCPDGSTRPCGFEEKLVLATAICGENRRPFTLIDRTQQVHLDLGIRIEDPWQTPTL